MSYCDPEILENGIPICYFHAPSAETEAWVQKVSAAAGQRMDWGYQMGRAHVLVLGSYSKARAAVEQLLPELEVYDFHYYPAP